MKHYSKRSRTKYFQIDILLFLGCIFKNVSPAYRVYIVKCLPIKTSLMDFEASLESLYTELFFILFGYLMLDTSIVLVLQTMQNSSELYPFIINLF